IGLDYPVVHSRGKLILMVDKSRLTDPVLARSVKRLQSDMTGDGWQVIRHDVDRGLKSYDGDQPLDLSSYDPQAYKIQVEQMRNLIKADYDADTSNPKTVKAVFLFGH